MAPQYKWRNGCYFDVIHFAIGAMRFRFKHTDQRLVKFDHIHWHDGWRICLGQHCRYVGTTKSIDCYLVYECSLYCCIQLLSKLYSIYDLSISKWCSVSKTILSWFFNIESIWNPINYVFFLFIPTSIKTVWAEVVPLFGHILLNFNRNPDEVQCWVSWQLFGRLEIYL